MEISQQSYQDWTPKRENNVVMRTASFGRGHTNGLEVCARRDDYVVNTKEGRMETMKGLGKDVFVPLGLIAATRMQMKLERRLPIDCWQRLKD